MLFGDGFDVLLGNFSFRQRVMDQIAGKPRRKGGLFLAVIIAVLRQRIDKRVNIRQHREAAAPLFVREKPAVAERIEESRIAAVFAVTIRKARSLLKHSLPENKIGSRADIGVGERFGIEFLLFFQNHFTLVNQVGAVDAQLFGAG